MKQFLSKNFDMKDMGAASYAIDIKIHSDRSRGILGLSQETYINKILERFRMKDCSPSMHFEREQMKNIPYASVVGSLMYAQVYTRPDIVLQLEC